MLEFGSDPAPGFSAAILQRSLWYSSAVVESSDSGDNEEVEAALAHRLRSGEVDAFEELAHRYGGVMLAVARRILRDENDARDALQDGYLSAIRGIDRFRGDGSLRGWLHRIVANAALMKLRKRRRHPEESIDELLPSFSPDGHRIDPGPPWRPDEELEGEELRRSVRDCMKRLPAGYREVLVLRDVEEFDTAETAALLEVTHAAVKVRLHRARQALRTLLDAPGSPVRARRRP